MKPKIVPDPPKPSTTAPAATPSAAPSAASKTTPTPAATKPDGFDPNLPTPPRRQPQPDIQSIVKAAVTGAMEASRPTVQPKSAPELPKAISRKLEKLDLLDGSEFKTIRKEAEVFYSPGGLEETYRSEWSRKNPGKKFDRTATEHDDFYSDNDPLVQVSEDDWEEARDRFAISKATESARNAAADTISKKDQEARRGSAVQQATETVDRIFAKSIAGLSPELAELAKDPAKLSTLPKVDKVAAHVAVQTARKYEGAINGVEEIFSAGEKFDPKNPAHQAVDGLGVELEDILLRAQPKDRRKGELEFSTMAEYSQMTPAEKRKHWTIGRGDLLNFIEYRQTQEAMSLYKDLTDSRPVAGGRPAENGSVNTDTATAPPSNSPSIGSSVAAPPPGTPNSSGGKGNTGGFFGSLRS